jgi:hypothetical protein
MDRHRGANCDGRIQLGSPVFTLASPSTVSGLSSSHSTGSGFCAAPVTTMVGSICCGKNWTGWPFGL